MIRFTRQQRGVLSALSASRTRADVIAASPSWCFACGAAVQPQDVRVSNDVAYCPLCGQATLVPVDSRFESIQEALGEFARWLSER